MEKTSKGLVLIGHFHGCTGLTGTIPENLFKDCINATSFNQMLDGCVGLTGEIPAKLFEKCTKVTSFASTFRGCEGLTGVIPEGLFDSCTNVTNFSQTFRNCTGLTGKIPENLFKNCPNVERLDMVFSCTSITEIPVSIFDINNGQPNGITTVAGAFEGTKIKNVPSGLFDLCTEVTNFGNNNWGYAGIFQDCQLLETIPDKLFYNNTKAVDFNNAFLRCFSLKEIPENIFNTSQENVSMSGVFYRCESLTKISGNIFKNVPNIAYYDKTFYGCSNLTEIGEEFSISDSAINMTYIFGFLNNLSIFPSKIIIPEGVTSINHAFYGCNQLKTTIVLKTNSTSYSLSFYGVNSESRVNWSAPCTEEFVDEILENSYNTTIKGIEE